MPQSTQATQLTVEKAYTENQGGIGEESSKPLIPNIYSITPRANKTSISNLKSPQEQVVSKFSY